MRLILTRAAADAARTCKKLEHAGHHVIMSPVIEIVPIPIVWPAGVVDAVVASSAQAFIQLPEQLSPECRRLLPLLLVGARTAEAAAAAGFVGRAMTSRTAGALVASIGEMARRPRRAVHLVGRDRKPDLEKALQAMDLSSDLLEVYEARAVERPSHDALMAFRNNTVDGVLHFSRRSATLFLAAAEKGALDIRRAAHYCLSEDAAEPIRQAGFDTIRVAEEPNEGELLRLVGSA